MPTNQWLELMIVLPDIAVGAIGAALIAGVVSLLGLVISKEQKVSEFRQAWIDALRSEVASLISHVNAIHGATQPGFGGREQKWTHVREDFIGANTATANIRLRLNPSEERCKEVLRLVSELEREMAPGRIPEHARLDSIEHELVASAQILLKAEWMRVRNGEHVYRVANRVAAVAMLAGVALLLYAVLASAFTP